ncbi:50S ribosome-binding GTPase [candidate division KSB1 bacterium]|nr:50S ribosome-binding GTPase [candidate division KSB1 bacterium]
MPANLTPDYLRAEEDFKRARTPQDQLEALKKMMATLPKHKGTEKLQGDIKRRMSAVREEIQKGDRKKGFGIKVDPEGAGQVALAGAPNSGKSQLVAALTQTRLEVAPYPFTTRAPHPAMMMYEDIQIQLVDLPPISRQHMEFWVPNIIRTCDLVLIVFDLSNPDILDEIEETMNLLSESKLKLVAYRPETDSWASVIEKRILLAGNKSDLPEAQENWGVVRELYAEKFPTLAVSALTGDNLQNLRFALFASLDVVRVYSKRPGQEADMQQPYIMPKGGTVVDFAREVHRDFAEKLKFARLWGHGKFEGQRVNRDYVLQDRDVIELHV